MRRRSTFPLIAALALIICLLAPMSASAYVKTNALQRTGLEEFLSTAPELSPVPPTAPNGNCNAVCVNLTKAAKGDVSGISGAEVSESAFNIRKGLGFVRPAGAVAAAAGAFYAGWKIGKYSYNAWTMQSPPSLPYWQPHTTIYSTQADWFDANFAGGDFIDSDLPSGHPYWIWTNNYRTDYCDDSSYLGFTPLTGVFVCGGEANHSSLEFPAQKVGESYVRYRQGNEVRTYAATTGLVEGPYRGDQLPTDDEIWNWPVTMPTWPAPATPGIAPWKDVKKESHEEEDNENGNWKKWLPIIVALPLFFPEDGLDPGVDGQDQIGPDPSPLDPPTTVPDPSESEDGTDETDPSDDGSVTENGTSGCTIWAKPKIKLGPLHQPIGQVFPFGIPFALYRMVASLDNTPVTPEWNTTVWGESMTISLERFDGVAATARIIFLFMAAFGLLLAFFGFARGNPGGS